MKLARDLNGNVMQVGQLGTTATIDGKSASAASDVISATDESVVRLAAFDNVYIAIGATPTASASTIFFPAGIEYVLIPAGAKIAVFGGKLNITMVA